jgi:hypothetical protein
MSAGVSWNPHPFGFKSLHRHSVLLDAIPSVSFFAMAIAKRMSREK